MVLHETNDNILEFIGMYLSSLVSEKMVEKEGKGKVKGKKSWYALDFPSAFEKVGPSRVR